MIRRSKIKVRPAIRKPGGPAAAPTKPSCTISTKDYTTNNLGNSFPQQMTNEILKQNTAIECATDAVKTLESEKDGTQEAIESKLDNQTNSEQKMKTNTPPSKVVPQKSRRRKLVACPLTAKDRPRLNHPQSEKKAVYASPPEDPQPVSNVPLEINLQRNENISPQSLDHLADDPVKNVVSEVIVDDGEMSEMNDTNQPKEYTSMQTVENAKDYISGLPDHFNSENSDNNLCNTLNSNLDNNTDTLHRKDNIHVTSQVKKKSEKRRSSITTYRNKAKTKLRKLMDDQGSETNCWPTIDHNVISMSDLIYLNPPVNSGLVLGMNVAKASSAEEIVSSPHPASGVETAITPVCNTSETQSSMSTASEEPEALPVPQIRIAEDGSVVVDEESLIMEQKKPETVSRGEAVYEFGRETTVNQYSFRKRPLARSSKWSQAETDKFYRCLCIVGAEFSMMSAMFGKRSADDLRRKYRRERKIHPSRVDQAMMQQHLSKWSDDMFELKNISDKDPDKSEKADVT